MNDRHDYHKRDPTPASPARSYGLSLPSGYYALPAATAYQPQRYAGIGSILERGYFTPAPSDPVMAVIDDRALTTGLGLDDAIARIRHRYDIYRGHVADLQQARQRAVNAAQNWHYPAGWVESGRHADLETTLRDFDQQIREQQLSLWRDVGRIRESLPTWIQDYLSAHRRRQWLDERGGDEF